MAAGASGGIARHIRSERQGVEMRSYSRCGEVNERFPGLIPAILSVYQKVTL